MSKWVSNQKWFFIAFGAVVIFGISAGVFFWRRRVTQQRRAKYSALSGDDVAMSAGMGADADIVEHRKIGKQRDVLEGAADADFGDPVRRPRQDALAFQQDVAVPAALPQGYEMIDAKPRTWILHVKGQLGSLPPFLASLPVADLAVEEARLEDVLVKYYRDGAE